VAAVMAWLFVEETLTIFDSVGLAIASLGVYIATRKESDNLS
jgi:drug/metabolite transporter (DMT)-like permease